MDRTSFNDAIVEHKDAVFGYAVYLLGSRHDAEDVTQDVFLSFWRDGDSVPSHAIRAWLIRVCRNACIDLHRRNQVRVRSTAATRVAHEKAWGPAAVRGAAEDQPPEPTDQGREVARIEATLALDEVSDVISTLSEPGRSILVLREVYGLPYDEIASALELPMSSVKVTLHRARKRLRALLTERGTAS